MVIGFISSIVISIIFGAITYYVTHPKDNHKKPHRHNHA
jgi:hypothetical protein